MDFFIILIITFNFSIVQSCVIKLLGLKSIHPKQLIYIFANTSIVYVFSNTASRHKSAAPIIAIMKLPMQYSLISCGDNASDSTLIICL